MKKIILVLAAFMAISAPVFAQGDEEATAFFEQFVISFAAMVAALPFVVEFLKVKLNLAGLALQVTSWVVGVVISLGAHYFNLGIFEGLGVWQSVIIGAGASLAANGVADTGLVQTILRFLGIFQKKQ